MYSEHDEVAAGARERLLAVMREMGLVDESLTDEIFLDRTEQPLTVLGRLGKLADIIATARKIAARLGVEFINLHDVSQQDKWEIKEFTRIFDSALCWRRKFVPLWATDTTVYVVFANPMDYDAMEKVKFLTGKAVTAFLGLESEIESLLNRHYPRTDFSSDECPANVEVLGESEEEYDVGKSSNPPIIKMVNKIISDAYTARASDIHLEPTQYSLDVRFRIDGVMHFVTDVPKRLQPYLLSRVKIMAGLDIAERRKPQDGRIRVRVNNSSLDLRVSTVPASYGEKIVMRLLIGEDGIMTMSSLGVPELARKRFERVLKQKGKMLLVTGPTGSGKTTTLYAAIHTIRDGSKNIETVEDPIELRIAGVNQIQVNEDAGVTFSSALRSILRQDPDVIMIGEIRDEETGRIALQAAQTGHLVLSTLHTNDALSAVTRLQHLGLEPYIIASSVAGVMAQRLVRSLCPHCRQHLEEGEIAHWQDVPVLKEFDFSKTFRPAGCAHCSYTGYYGRVGIYSYLDICDDVASAIGRGESETELKKIAIDRGFVTIEAAALELLSTGLTSLEEVGPYLKGPSGVSVTTGLMAIAEAADNISEEVMQPVMGIELSVSSARTISSDTSLTKSIGKSRLLLVEDDQNVRDVYRLLFEREMFAVETAVNGLDGLEKVFASPPDIIVCDLMMPVMDGREFLQRLRSRPVTENIPVIFLTAVSTEKNEIDLLSLGASDFVAKDASPKILISRVLRLLR